MRKLFILILMLFWSIDPLYAVVGMKEEDGSPDDYYYQIIVANNTLTDHGDATVDYHPEGTSNSDECFVFSNLTKICKDNQDVVLYLGGIEAERWSGLNARVTIAADTRTTIGGDTRILE